MSTHTDNHCYVPDGSHWPVVGSPGLLFLMVGVSSWLNGANADFYIMLTGFHGMHVTIGAIMLTTIWFRVLKGHFTAERHFAFEAVA